MEENVIQIKIRTTKIDDASVKNIIYVKKIVFWILLLVVVKIENV